MTNYFDVPERKAYYDFRRKFYEINEEIYEVSNIIPEVLGIKDNLTLDEFINKCNKMKQTYPEYSRIVLDYQQGYEGDADDFILVGYRLMTPVEKEEFIKVNDANNELEERENTKRKLEEFNKLKSELYG